MCSTPRPKSMVKAKLAPSGTILSNMSSGARSRFAERANTAQERRDQIAIKTRQTKIHLDSGPSNTKKVVSGAVKKTSKSFSYWLLNASLKEIFMTILFGRSKRA